MKTIGIICSRLPYPPIGGALSKNFNLIKGLSKYFKLKIIIISEIPVSEEAKSVLSEFGELHVFYKPRKAMYRNLLTAAFYLPRPLQVSIYFFRDVAKQVEEIFSGVDLVLGTLVRTAPYVENLPVPIVFDLADSIGLNYQKGKDNTTSKFLKLYYSFEAPLLISYEKRLIEKSRQCLFFSKKELEFFSSPEKTTWIPHGINESLFSYDEKPEQESAVCFLGKMDYQPNVDAAIWFVDKVLPLLSKNIKFYIIGTKPVPSIRALASDRVIVTGFMEDPFVLAKSCIAMVAPMLNGGGIQNKVLEGMALGTANVISSQAAEPIDGGRNGTHFLVADTPNEMAEQIHRLQNDPTLRKNLGSNARELAFAKYSWTASINEYKKVILKELN